MCSMHQQNSSVSTRNKDTKKEKQRKHSKGEKECEWQKDGIKSCDLIEATEAKGDI